MDYSELVKAIQTGDSRTADRLCAEATPILKKYLVSKIGADPFDADDAVQKMFEYVIEKIQSGDIENPKGLLAYMLATCRHSYFNIVRTRSRAGEVVSEEPVSIANQLLSLVDEEKQKILKKCIEKLRKNYRDFIEYWFSFPDSETEDIAEHFGISVSNTWIRKHRIVKKLSDCVNKF